MYLAYSDYVEGSISKAVAEDAYLTYEGVAESVIDSYTFSVLRKDPAVLAGFSDVVKKAMVAQMDYMGGFSSIDAYLSEAGKAVASHSINVGGTSESVTYRDDPSLKAQTAGLKVAPLAVAILAPIRAMGRRL